MDYLQATLYLRFTKPTFRLAEMLERLAKLAVRSCAIIVDIADSYER